MSRQRGRRRAWTWGLVLALLLAVAAAAAELLRPRGVAVQLAAAHRGELLVQIQCDGTLEAPPGGELRATEGGLVAALEAHDGDHVRAGQTLLRLDDAALVSQCRDAEAVLLRVQTEAKADAAALATATRDEEHWTAVVAADRSLVDEAAATRSELERDLLALSEATGRQRATAAKLAAAQGPGSQEELARSAVTDCRARVSALVVRAPSDGVVYGLPRRLGDVVERGQLLASVVDPDHPRVRLRVDQPDVPRIAVGQRLVVTFSGLPGEQWEGRVTVAAPVLREAAGREVGEVAGEVADPRHLLPLNASVDARIVLAEKTAVLTVPRSALYREGGRRFVYVLRRGRAHRQEVSVGLVGLTDVEITGGLDIGQSVVVAGEIPLVEGLRVAPPT
jgi:RND family efflux transporter MFP subunit